jgi:hypothetical protein
VIPTDDLVCNDGLCGNFGQPADPQTCDRSHFRPANGPWRDGRLWVLTDKCGTCIFRPGNLMHLAPGDRDRMVDACIERQSPIVCHQTLDGPRSVCRGFYDLHRQDIVPLVLAEAMNLIEFDLPPAEDDA